MIQETFIKAEQDAKRELSDQSLVGSYLMMALLMGGLIVTSLSIMAVITTTAVAATIVILRHYGPELTPNLQNRWTGLPQSEAWAALGFSNE